MTPLGALSGDRRPSGTALRRHAVMLAQIGPALAYYAAFFAVPLAILAAFSVFERRGFDVVPAFQLDGYITAITDPLYRNVLAATVAVALVTAVVVVVLAYPFAYIITFVFPRRRELLLFLVLASLFSGYVVRIYAWRTILGSEGIVNSVLLGLGVIQDPIRDLLNSRLAVTITLTNILFPIAILPLYSAMQNIPRDVLDAAADLGAGRLRVFLTIMFPLTSGGFRAAFAFAFILSAGDYVTPALVGGQSGIMMGNVIATMFGIALNWPLGAALAMTMIAAVLLVYLVLMGALRLVTR